MLQCIMYVSIDINKRIKGIMGEIIELKKQKYTRNKLKKKKNIQGKKKVAVVSYEACRPTRQDFAVIEGG